MILGKTWLNTHGVLIDMLHDKLIFRPNRCDHDLPTSPTTSSTPPNPKELKQPPPQITRILKRGIPVDCSLQPEEPTTGCPSASVPVPSADAASVLEKKQDNDGNESPAGGISTKISTILLSTPTKKARKPRKKRKKVKEQVTGGLPDEPRPVSIAMIGAAAFRSLTQKKDVKTFSITPC